MNLFIYSALHLSRQSATVEKYKILLTQDLISLLVKQAIFDKLTHQNEQPLMMLLDCQDVWEALYFIA